MVWTGRTDACDCNPSSYQVLPPEKLADGSRFLAPSNTKVWVIETVAIPSPKRHFIVLKHGDRSVSAAVAQAWSDSAYRRSSTDCRLHYAYQVTEVAGSFEPQRQYDVVRELDQKLELLATFWTGSQRDVTPPSVEGPLSCVGEDGNQPAEATCNWFLPALNVNVSAHDDNTPDKLLLYRVKSLGKQLAAGESDSVSPLLAVEPNHVRLSSGNVCEGRTTNLPEPFEPGRLDVSVVDLAGNQSQIRTCDFVGPQTYEVRKALERVHGCPAPQPIRPLVPQPWPKSVAVEHDCRSVRLWLSGLSAGCALLLVACLVLIQRLRQLRR
jgi:hypothetical protein